MENYRRRQQWQYFRIHEDPAFRATYQTGIEMQILDNQKAEDNKKATYLAGSVYDLQAPLHRQDVRPVE